MLGAECRGVALGGGAGPGAAACSCAGPRGSFAAEFGRPSGSFCEVWVAVRSAAPFAPEFPLLSCGQMGPESAPWRVDPIWGTQTSTYLPLERPRTPAATGPAGMLDSVALPSYESAHICVIGCAQMRICVCASGERLPAACRTLHLCIQMQRFRDFSLRGVRPGTQMPSRAHANAQLRICVPRRQGLENSAPSHVQGRGAAREGPGACASGPCERAS